MVYKFPNPVFLIASSPFAIYSTWVELIWGLILLIHYWFLRVAALGPLIPLFCVLPCYMWSCLQSMIVFQMVSPFLEQPIYQPINFWTGPPTWGSPFFSQSGLRFTQQPLAWEQASVCLSASREELCISIWAYKILFPTLLPTQLVSFGRRA